VALPRAKDSVLQILKSKILPGIESFIFPLNRETMEQL
jgi:hypothetical protein